MHRVRLTVYKFAAVVLSPVAFFVSAELLLNLGGVGKSTRVFKHSGDLAQGNWGFTFKYFPWSMARPMAPVSFARKKPEDTFRIFILGGSAAQGFPSPDFGIADQLEAILELAYPERDFEVINAAVTAINSHVVLPIAKACLEYEPDALVVYTGNNEVVGPFGPGTTLAAFNKSRAAIKGLQVVKSTRLSQLMSMALGSHRSPSGSWRGMNLFLENTVAQSDKRLDSVYRIFEANLAELLEAARDESCPVVLSTIGVNLVDNPPFGSLRDETLSDALSVEWGDRYAQGMAHQERGNFPEAISEYLKACKIDETHSEIHYRLARCYEALGSNAKARDSYIRSLDLDVLRFRADSRLNSIVRSLSKRAELTGGGLTDSARALEKASLSNTGLPGDALFYDHVHLSFKGTYIVARTIGAELVPTLNLPRRPFASEEEITRFLAFSDWDRHQIRAKLAGELLNGAPFSNQWDHKNNQLARVRFARRLSQNLTPQAMAEIGASLETQAAKRPEDWGLQVRWASFLQQVGRVGEAKSLLDRVMREAPHHYSGRLALSSLLIREKHFSQAERHLKTILDENPYAIELRSEFLRLLVARRDLNEAEDYGRSMISDHPEDPDIRILYGIVLSSIGNEREALASFRQARTIDANKSDAWRRTIQLLIRGRNAKAALLEADLWVERDPMCAEAHQMRADLLAQVKEFASAVEAYRQALDLDPDLFLARSRYVQIMSSLGNLDDLITSFREELGADPDILQGFSILGLVLDHAGRKREAIETYERGLERNPSDAKLMRELAWIYSTSKDPAFRNSLRGIELARAATRQSPQNADFQHVLAAAQADNGQIQRAIETASRAVELARSSGQTQLASVIERSLTVYEIGLPLRLD